MEFYATWVYRNILNNQWLIWVFVITIFVLNLLSPIFIWMIMNGRSITQFLMKVFRSKKKQQSSKSSS